ncbi:rhomboid family intramembrane serine protease [Kutzneria buriramensis]|uniref:Membrane associated rhomboid family serine protease n=1 Tax=Kutzneria buriramensis TaxID=1045776 RepID=A0A3E0HTW6_9PSEU|nr:rhomboid family intramembrane serine protease [Kutzneria buriramensis]REH49897.1 membrane associated rhomboid family serine protease [Kutzneria buriramensis]
MTAPYGQPTDALPACYRHPGRHTGLRCTRCDRPTCPECLRDAAVGQQCVECVNEGRRATRQPVTWAGARVANRQPVLVYLLIAVNVVIYAITAVEAGSFAGNTNSPLFYDWVMWPQQAATQGEWWRVLTSGFLHIGFIHLAVNMFSLWMIGRDLERVLGRIRFAAVYFLSLIGGSIGVMLFAAPNSGAAGASTALYGLLGCYLVAVVRLKMNPRPILITLAINVFLTFSLGLSIQGHFGGLVVGAIAMAAIVYAPQANRARWQGIALSALFVVLVLIYATRAAQLASALGPGS